MLAAGRHRRAYDTGRLDLLAYLEPRWRREIAHAVAHLWLIVAYRRLTGRLPPADAGPRRESAAI